MLDTATKRRIDTARDILVGKVPDPKSQVEQITIALIYKFMDDIDAASEELGGQRTFFAGDFARYGWPQLVRAGLGGHETLNLYAEAITRMPENPGIPPLFRDIFNNAYLPYRDPETLRAFLKVIDEFTYDHSERLGDAFEYLLSVLGSQGDAGQFRTPRHIIDFIVAIVDPKKDETVLDPACGTAGFLISSYKHILKTNADDEGNSTLTPDEKGALADNFNGYDISPDMVRLSLVNLYLHGFVEPHISEYDTLTSEERWNEYADVILANPPFMSPKGGIRPHRRFSVQSKRSEVLFVDYMAEHLTPTGRAGIIVPEGIVFQSQTAYKQLRKMLVENYLVAVISLPAGVFQPYSGVKTSILLLDRALAQKTDRIAFFKVENDGFGLGAQRREIAENDLPQVKEELGEYLGRLRVGESVTSDGVAELGVEYTTTLGLIAEKEKIAAGGEYGLSGERYRESGVRRKTKWPMVGLGSVIRILNGYAFKSKNYVTDGIRVIRITNVQRGRIVNNDPKFYPKASEKSISKYMLNENDLLLSLTGNVGRIGILSAYYLPAALNQRVACLRPDNDKALTAYIFYLLNHNSFEDSCIEAAKGLAQKNLSTVWLSKYRIPLPPLEVQREIVAEIEVYQRVIDGARAVIDNYRPQIVVDPEWPMVELGEICANFQNGANFSKDQMGRGTLFVNIKDLFSLGVIDCTKLERVELTKIEVERKKLAPDDLLFVRSSVKEEGVGYPSLMADADEPIVFCGFIIKCSPNRDNVLPTYLLHLLRTSDFRAKVVSLSNRANITNISQDSLKALQVPLPPLETQQAIVAEIEAEQSLVAANRELVERMEGKIRAAIGRVWGKGDTVPAMTKVEND